MTASSSISHIVKAYKSHYRHKIQFFFWDQAKAKLWKTHSKLKGSIPLEKNRTQWYGIAKEREVAHKSMKDMNWT